MQQLRTKGISVLNRVRTQLDRAWQTVHTNTTGLVPLLTRDEEARKRRELLRLLAESFGLTPFDTSLRNALPSLSHFTTIPPQTIPATPQKPASKTPLLLQSTALTLAVTDSSVTTEKADFTAHDADQIALLCALNPAMRSEPVKLHGNARECFLLNLAVTARGLTVQNPQSFASLTAEEKTALTAEWNTRLQPKTKPETKPEAEPAQNPAPPAEPAPETGTEPPTEPATEAAPEPAAPSLPPSVQQALARANTPLPEKIRTLLEGAGIAETTYREAREAAIQTRKTSLTSLRKHFTLSAQQATIVLEAFNIEGITSKTTTQKTEHKVRTDHKVILKPDQALPPPAP